MFGGKPARGLPKPPPPPPYRAWNWRLSHVEKRQIESPKCQNGLPEWYTGVGGGGQFRHFSINQQRSNISRCFFHTEMCVSFPLLIAVSNCAHLLSACCEEEDGVYIYIYKRTPKLVTSPQSTTLHFTGNISAEDSVYKNKVGHNNTRGIVSSLLFFPLKLLLHKVYISNILCGLRL